MGLLLAVLVLGVAGALILREASPEYGAYRKDIFQRLNAALAEKKSRTLALLGEQEALAVNAASVLEFVDAFKRMQTLFTQRRYGTESYRREERTWEERFVASFAMFYDLLFIDLQGTVFYSIKQESDFLTNLHDPRYDGSPLAKAHQRLGRDPVFVGFHHYPPSREPAGFWLVPVFQGDQRLGSIAMQFPIHQFNRIFTDREGLGRTGEVYLVDADRFMLTESRFLNGDLERNRLKINTQATLNAPHNSSGRLLQKDYRGKRVFSVYENLTFRDTTMVVIAEIDESEVLAEYFLAHQKVLLPPLLAWLGKAGHVPAPSTGSREHVARDAGLLNVDVQEYRRDDQGLVLGTNGVATCTAFAVYRPGGFGYLAHIPPTDEAYGPPFLTRYILGRAYTSLAEEVTDKALWFDVLPKDRGSLRFLLAATRPEAFPGILRMLLNKGVAPHQIQVIYDPTQASVSLDLDYARDSVTSYWRSFQGDLHATHDVPTLEQALVALLGVRPG